MSLTPDQVERIKARSPGWKEDWGQLCVVLLGDDGESGALVQAVRSLRIGWPDELERDDFIADVLAAYHRRVLTGGLLEAYDPDSGSVVSFLTTHRVLRVEAIKYLKKRAMRQLCSFDDDHFAPHERPRAKPDLDAGIRPLTTLIAGVQQQLEQLTLEGIKRVTRPVEQAGLQLYPRLDWSQPAMKPVQDRLLQVLCSASDGADRLAALARSHEHADQMFLSRLQRVAAKIHNKGKGVPVRTRELLEQRFADLVFQRVFLPLDAAALVALLGITSADAAQRRHRYREELPRLLPRLQGVFNDLVECRQEASKENSV